MKKFITLILLIILCIDAMHPMVIAANDDISTHTIAHYKNAAKSDIQIIDYIMPSYELLMSYESYKQNITVTLNGETLNFDQPPIIYNNRTLVPLRAIFEAFGAIVTWDGNMQTAIAKKGSTTIKLTIGAYEFYKNGGAIPLEVPGMIINNRTLVPVRAISEAFDCDVNWDGNTQTVHIYSDKLNDTSETVSALIKYAKSNLPTLSQDDFVVKTYGDVRFLLADVSEDDEPELLAVGVEDNELQYLEIYQYTSGNVINILKDYFGYAYGGAMDLVWYDGGVRIRYVSGSSESGFMNRLMKYENGNWTDIYITQEVFDFDNGGQFEGYLVNGEYVTENEFNSIRADMARNPVTISDFAPLDSMQNASNSNNAENFECNPQIEQAIKIVNNANGGVVSDSDLQILFDCVGIANVKEYFDNISVYDVSMSDKSAIDFSFHVYDSDYSDKLESYISAIEQIYGDRHSSPIVGDVSWSFDESEYSSIFLTYDITEHTLYISWSNDYFFNRLQS